MISSSSSSPDINFLKNIDELTYSDLIMATTTNTIYKISKNQALVYLNNKWIHFQVNTPPQTVIKYVPISNCLNQQYGDGGAIEFETTTIFGMINTFDLTLTLSVIFYYEKFSHTWELVKMLTLRNIYYCNVPRGNIGQIWISLYLEEFSRIEYRVVEDDKFYKEIKKKKKKRKKKWLRRKLSFGKWKDLGKVMLLNGNKSPIIHCNTGASLDEGQLDCSSKALLKNKDFQVL